MAILPANAVPGDASARAQAGRSLPRLRVLLAAPRGFCAGVDRAIVAVEEALERFGAPVYVRRPIVHNLTVVRALESKGAVFVEELDQIPEGAVVLSSAHGATRAVARDASRRGLNWFDAVCPLVSKVHREVVRHHRAGRHVILIGHHGHPEIEGTVGQVPDGAVSVVGDVAELRALPLRPTQAIAYAVQTTYSVEEAEAIIRALTEAFDDVQGPSGSDICYATTNRQAALRAIATRSDAVIVAGASFSSNANRLAELARAAGCVSVQLIADAGALDWNMLSDAQTIGITSAASTPEATVCDILALLGERYSIDVQESGEVVETVTFKPVPFDNGPRRAGRP